MSGITLTENQQKVFDGIKTFIENDASVFILRGYAGTGKTTMVKHVADYIAQHTNVALMAPTGRAARVLTLKTGYKATTIHKAIYSGKALVTNGAKDLAETEFKIRFGINAADNKTVAIVDEASMLSSRKSEHELFSFGTDNLMDDLLTFIRPLSGGKLIFVGDPAQLPPVSDNASQALNVAFFEAKGLKVMQAELTEVLRQTGDSVILKNAMRIRDLLGEAKRNRLVFEEKENDVERVPAERLLPSYLEARTASGRNDCVVICHTNATAARYNKDIRQALYNTENPKLRVGDILMIVQNNYNIDRMNGEFVPVLYVGENIVTQTAPVYVQECGVRKRTTITLRFIHVQVTNGEGIPVDCMLSLDLLESSKPTLNIDEQRALYINFCMRNPRLRQGTEAFADALANDAYFNCIRAKYGYAVTGHKCQGGEWSKVFVDYTGRTGLNDDCLRWAYTATTRASKTLFFANLPHITPFTKFRIEPIQRIAKSNEEFRALGVVGKSPFHRQDAPDYLHAKWMCINHNMEWTPYSIDRVESHNYQEIYYIKTPDGIEQYCIRYKKGGMFAKAVAMTPTSHSVLISIMLDDENYMPIEFEYHPSDKIHEELYNLVRSACDDLSVQITNVVECKSSYYVNYYFRTSYTVSSLKVYIDSSGFVTYAKPMSLIGEEDGDLATLIEYIQNRFE